MKAWKRNLLIVYVVCSAVVAVVFFTLVYSSSMWGFFKFLLTLAGIVMVCGVAVGAYLVVYAFMHEHATLHVGPEGAINIERSALESTARRAIATIEGVALQKVTANVIERRGEPVIDLTVTAVPFGTESLMAMAGRIQASVKRAVEAFTDHEVRYVAVNFIEPRRREESKAADRAVDARAASGYVPPRYAPCNEPVGQASRCGDETVETAPSLWERIKGRASALVRPIRGGRDEDVVETDAIVEEVSVEKKTSPSTVPSSETQYPRGGDDVDCEGVSLTEDSQQMPRTETVPEEPVEGVAYTMKGERN